MTFGKRRQPGQSRQFWQRWTLLAGCALWSLAAGPGQAQAPEQKDVRLGVGGASALYYLPLALTDRLGYFKEQGLNVEINDLSLIHI